MPDDYHAELIAIGRVLDRIADALGANAHPAQPAPFRAVSAVPAPVGADYPREGVPHMPGHRPLRSSSKGLFCPTKMDDGSWCSWRSGNGMQNGPVPAPQPQRAAFPQGVASQSTYDPLYDLRAPRAEEMP